MLENEETRRPYIIQLVSGMGIFSFTLLPASALVRSILIGVCMLIVAICTVILAKRSEKKLKPIAYGVFFEIAGVLQLTLVPDLPGGLPF